jgi:hypothetical protein
MSHAVFLDYLSEALRKEPVQGLCFICFCAAAALEALLSVVKLAVSLAGILFLHLGAFVRFVPPNNAATRGPQNSMMGSIMARDATDDGAFNAALCVS